MRFLTFPSTSSVSRWVREYRKAQEDTAQGGLSPIEIEVENRRLRKENKRLLMDECLFSV
jgi:hypothetical protein